MKTLILLCSLIWATVCQAQVNNVQTMFCSADATCETARDSCIGTQDTTVTVGASASGKYRAVQFYAQASTTLCAGTAKMRKQNSPTFGMVFEIWSNNDVNADSVDGTDDTLDDDLPDTKIGTSATSVDAAGVAATYEDVGFSGTFSAPIIISNFYWLVAVVDTVGDATDHIVWGVEASACDGSPNNAEMRTDNDGLSWSALSNTTSAEFQLYSE